MSTKQELQQKLEKKINKGKCLMYVIKHGDVDNRTLANNVWWVWLYIYQYRYRIITLLKTENLSVNIENTETGDFLNLSYYENALWNYYQSVFLPTTFTISTFNQLINFQRTYNDFCKNMIIQCCDNRQIRKPPICA